MGAGKGKSRRTQTQLFSEKKLKRTSVHGFPLPEVTLLSKSEAHKNLEPLLIKARGPRPGCWDVMDVAWKLSAELGEQYECVGNGDYRYVFRGEGVVYKIPCSDRSRFDSCVGSILEEAANAKNGYGEIPIAKTELVWHETGIPIIVMEEVDVSIPKSELPGWARAVEGAQVGRSKATNEFVAYDFDEPPLPENVRALSIKEHKEWLQDWYKQHPIEWPLNI